MHTCAHTYASTTQNMRTFTGACVHEYRLLMHVHAHVYAYVYVYTYAFTCICVYICVYIHTRVYLKIYVPIGLFSS